MWFTVDILLLFTICLFVFEVIIFIPTETLKCLNESFLVIINVKIRLFIFFTKFLQIYLNLNWNVI